MQYWEKSLVLLGHSGSVSSVCYSPDGSFLASGSIDKTIRLWNMPGGEKFVTFFDPLINEETNAREVKVMGNSIITVPCGTPLPSGAICICDCVAASQSYPGPTMVCTCNTILVPSGTYLSGSMTCICDTVAVGIPKKVCSCNSVETCSCNQVCTCDKVCSCNNNVTYLTYWYPN